jgi:hypothetical protein
LAGRFFFAMAIDLQKAHAKIHKMPKGDTSKKNTFLVIAIAVSRPSSSLRLPRRLRSSQ